MKKYLSAYPKLLKEWHPTKNGELKPEDITHGSHKKVWWLCSKKHSFEAAVCSRTKSKPSGCPYCSGNALTAANSLYSKFPKLAEEWHPEKNGNLTPNDLSYGSKRKVWWLCARGHSYQSTSNRRTSEQKSGCPYCAGKLVNNENNLELLHPEIAKSWHPTLNGSLTPDKVTYGSGKKVWWLCPNGHTYYSSINRKTSMKISCPFCSGKRVSEDNSLSNLYPEIAKEWHPSYNENITPKMLTSGSNKKVWWLCPKGHSYQASVKSRAKNKTNCPLCTTQSSAPEIRILSELNLFFEKVEHRYKLEGVETDIFIPEVNLAIEFDGSYWHKGKQDKDLVKNTFFSSKNINLIRVRGTPLKALTKNDIIVNERKLEKDDLNKIMLKIIQFTDIKVTKKIESYIKKATFMNDELFNRNMSYFPSPTPENALSQTHQEIASEWDFSKNFPLKPENFTHGSNRRMWWLCRHGHSYSSMIANRTKGHGCPYCSGRKTLNYDFFD